MAKTSKYRDLIYRMPLASLDTIPFHRNIESILRYAPRDFPLCLAVHEIEQTRQLTKKYTVQHKHKFPEINLLLGDVKYQIKLGNEEYITRAPASIWVPAGLEHSANVISGKGYFVCIILDKKYNGKKANAKK